MSTYVQVARKDPRKGRNKAKRVVTALPTTQAPPMEYKPIDLVEAELDEYCFQSNVSKKQRKKKQGEVDLSSSFAFRIRDYTKEELEAEGCRKIEAPQPGPQAGAQPGPQAVAQPGPQPGPQSAEQLQSANTDKKSVPAVKMSYSAMVTEKQQVEEKKPLTKTKTNHQETKQAVFQISELEFHSFVSKGEQVSRLEEEKVALLHEVERLNKQLKHHEAKAAANITLLSAEVTSKEATAREAVTEMEKLRGALEGELNGLKAALHQAQKDLKTRKQQLKEERSHRLSEQGETRELKAALHQVQEDLKNQRQQLEEERSHRLSDQEETRELKAALHQAQDDLKFQTQQWEQERSRFIEQQKETTCRMDANMRLAEKATNSVWTKYETERSHLLQKQSRERNKFQIAQNELLENIERLQLMWDNERSHIRCEQEKEAVRMETALSQAREDLEHYRRQWEEERSKLLEQHSEETHRMTEQLRQVQEELMIQRCQSEVDGSQLLTEQRETSKLEASLQQVQEDLEGQQEQTSLESISNTQQTPEREEEEERAPATTMMDELNILDGAIDEVTAKKPKKSLWKRFLGLFKRKRQTPSDGQ